MQRINKPTFQMLQKISQKSPIASKKDQYTKSNDVFERYTTVKDVAKEFRKKILIFSDWKDGMPTNGDEGSTLLREQLASFTNFVDGLSQKDAEYFTKLVFGEEQLKVIEVGTKKNVDVRLFQETLEKRLGKSIHSVVKTN